MKNILVLFSPPGRNCFKTELQQWLAASVLFSIVLLGVRIIFTGNFMFSFLVWNLFLAFIPYALSQWVTLNTRRIQNRLGFAAIFIAWLLFIPNSFYIITDLFHLGNFINMPLWYDLTMILSFAWNGMLLGVLSVRHIASFMEKHLSKRAMFLFIYLVMFLNALGIYIGRYLRFNSWDVVSDPFHLIKEIFNLASHPLEFKYVWGMVICFSVFMTLLYLTLINTGDGARMKGEVRDTDRY